MYGAARLSDRAEFAGLVDVLDDLIGFAMK